MTKTANLTHLSLVFVPQRYLGVGLCGKPMNNCTHCFFGWWMVGGGWCPTFWFFNHLIIIWNMYFRYKCIICKLMKICANQFCMGLIFFTSWRSDQLKTKVKCLRLLDCDDEQFRHPVNRYPSGKASSIERREMNQWRDGEFTGTRRRYLNVGFPLLDVQFM